jgi:prepilin-type N-terminal cleavage/methylation domain-containing protein
VTRSYAQSAVDSRRTGVSAFRQKVRARLSAHGGFTLIELLLVMLLSSIIAAAVLAVLQGTTRVFNAQEVRMLNQDDARSAINQMTRYLRMATSSADNGTTLSNAIATALPQEVEFYCDIDGDDEAEKARYYLVNSILWLQSDQPVWVTGTSPHWQYNGYDSNGVVIQNRVRNGTDPMFTYYRYVDEHGTLEAFTPVTAEDKMGIVTIGITIKVGERPDLAARDVSLSTDVQIRQRYQGGLQ